MQVKSTQLSAKRCTITSLCEDVKNWDLHLECEVLEYEVENYLFIYLFIYVAGV
jgi:hypothetical protein